MSNICTAHAEYVNGGDNEQRIKDVVAFGVNIPPLKWSGDVFSQRLSDAFKAAQIVQNIFN